MITQFAEAKLDQAFDSFKRSGGGTAQWRELLVAMLRYQEVSHVAKQPFFDTRFDEMICKFCCGSKAVSWTQEAKETGLIPKDPDV